MPLLMRAVRRHQGVVQTEMAVSLGDGPVPAVFCPLCSRHSFKKYIFSLYPYRFP